MSAIILLSAFLLQGAKTEAAFGIWSIIALITAGWSIVQNKKELPRFLLFVGGLFLAWTFLAGYFSLDLKASLFPILKTAFLTFVGYAFLLETPWKEKDVQWVGLLYGLATFSVILTGIQWVRGQDAYGFLPINTNFNAALLATLCLCLTDRSFTTPALTPVQRYGEGIIGALCGLLIVVGNSRSALLGLIVGGTILIGVRRSWITAMISLLGTSVIGMVCLSGWVMERFRLLTLEGARLDRLDFWEIAIRSFLDKPWWGVGPGNFELAYHQYAFPVDADPVRFARTTIFAHNEFLQTLTESGLPAAALLLAGCLYLLCLPVRQTFHQDAQSKSILACLFFIAFLNPIWHLPFLVLWTLLWMCIFLRGRIPLTTSAHPWPQRIFLLGGLALGALLLQFRPSVPRSLNNIYECEKLAWELESAGNLEPALSQYRRCVTLAPSRAINHLAIGRVFFRQGQFDQAGGWFEKARQIEPNYWETDLWNARCAYQMGRTSEARSILDNLLVRYRIYSPRSEYEAMVLGFDPDVVRQEKKAMAAKRVFAK